MQDLIIIIEIQGLMAFFSGVDGSAVLAIVFLFVAFDLTGTL